jgi:hypothetical protein
MLRKALIVAVTLIPGLVGSMVAVAAGPFFAEPSQASGAPFSAVAKMESTTVFADGNRIVRDREISYFRDGQGRTRTERGEGPNRVITINDPVSGERYIVRPQSKLVIAYKLSTGGAAPPPVVPSEDDDMAAFALLGFGMGIGAGPATEASSDTTSLGQKSINGLAATGSRLVRNIPSGALGNAKPITSTLDRWMSSDLGVPVQVSAKSSIGGDLTLNLGQIVRAEPDPALFAPPSDYARHDITLPSKVTAAVTK